MKLQVSYPVTGCSKTIEIDDENKLRCFYDARLAQEVAVDALGDEFKGYIFKITGGSDKDGFPMKQGVLTNSRVRLLLPRGTVGFQKWRGREGERRRKSVRGCIVGPDIAVLNVIIVKKGEKELPGLTDEQKEIRFGPKRASKIRRFFNLTKEDDVRKYVIRHKKKIGKIEVMKGPKIQRLVTPQRLRRKRALKNLMMERAAKRNAEREAYQKLLKKKKEAVEAAKKKAQEAKKAKKAVPKEQPKEEKPKTKK